jgi:hypothetical protein
MQRILVKKNFINSAYYKELTVFINIKNLIFFISSNRKSQFK